MLAGTDASDDEDQIYIVEEDDDDLTELQLQNAVLRKQLACVERAYKQLENDYLQLKDSHSLAIALIADVQFSNTTYGDSTADGARAAIQLTNALQADLAQKGHPDNTDLLIIWCPHPNASREFIKGFSSIKQTLVIDNNEAYKLKYLSETLFPLPQVKRMYVTLAGPSTTSIILPILSEAIQEQADTYIFDHQESSPKSGRRRRSFSSNSSRPSLARNGSNDNSLAKVVIAYSHSRDTSHQNAMNTLRSGLLQSMEGEKSLHSKVSELDFKSLFTYLECPDMFQTTVLPERPHTPISPIPATKLAPQESASYTPEAPKESPAKEAAAARPAETVWAQVVRRGKQKSEDKATTDIPSTPILASRQTSGPIIPLTPTSPVLQDRSTFGGNNASASRNRRQRGGRRESMDSDIALPISTASTTLDPNVSLCKQKKPPCNQHYLTTRGCTNPKCQYSHTYKLSTRQLEEMRQGAAKTPCVYRKTNQPCQSGDECVFGHVCPQGNKCKQGSRCQFPSAMH